ncbi:MAG: copper resistance CopC family protein, partial [Anaerolineales bacterium]
MRRWLAQPWLPLAAAALAALVAFGSAGAHAELLDSVPSAGSTIAVPPSEVRLTFSETLAEGSRLAVHGEQFRAVTDVTTIIAGSQMRGLLSATLEPGTYTVEWSAVSADKHLVSGSYPFTVAPPAPPAKNWTATIAAA